MRAFQIAGLLFAVAALMPWAVARRSSLCMPDKSAASITTLPEVNAMEINRSSADKGGHFAAMEQAVLFAQKMRLAFRTMRTA